MTKTINYGERVFVRYELGEGDETFADCGGIFIPFSSQLEAERQAASDLYAGAKPVEIFQADYHIKGDNPPHLNKDERKVLRNLARGFKTDAKKHMREINRETLKAEEDRLLEIHRAIEAGDLDLKNAIPGNAYRVMTGGTATAGAVALSAATAKTVLGVAAGSANQPSFTQVSISFDGISASGVPVLCEMVSGTNATNPPGTASTSVTPKQHRGWPAQSSQATAAYNWTSEPTVLEVYDKMLLTPNGGLIVIQFPMGREPTGIITAATQFKFHGIRLTAPAAVNCHCVLEHEE